MQEIIGQNEDIMFDLEQIKLWTQSEVKLSRAEKEHLDKIPLKKKREQKKEELLKKKEAEKKEFTRIWILELEEKVHASDLPTEIKNQILELTTYARSRDMQFIYDVERKIKEVERQIKEHEQKEMEKATKKIQEATAGVAAAVVAGAVLGPFIQVRYNEEEFNKKSVETYETKTLDELASAVIKEVKQYNHPKKQGSQYSQKHGTVMKTQQDEIADIMVRDTQRKQKEAGLPVQDAETIKANIEKMHPVKKRYAEKAIYVQNPELKQRHDEQKKEVASEEILKGIIRAKRRQEEKAVASLKKQIALLKRTPKTKETEEQIANRILSLEKRMADRLQTTMALGLFMDNFEKVMKQNSQTASSLLDLAKDEGKVNPDVIVNTISALDMKGMKMQHENTRKKAEEKAHVIDPKIKEEKAKKGLSAYIEKATQAEKTGAVKAKDEKQENRNKGLKKVFAENTLKISRKRVKDGVVKLTPEQKQDIMDRMVQKRKDYAKSA